MRTHSDGQLGGAGAGLADDLNWHAGAWSRVLLEREWNLLQCERRRSRGRAPLGAAEQRRQTRSRLLFRLQKPSKRAASKLNHQLCASLTPIERTQFTGKAVKMALKRLVLTSN